MSAIAKLVAAEGDADVASLPFEGTTVGETLTQLAAKLGENVSLGRVVRFEAPDGLVDAYTHTQNNRGTIGVLVELGGVDPSDADGAGSRARDLAARRRSPRPRTSRATRFPPMSSSASGR